MSHSERTRTRVFEVLANHHRWRLDRFLAERVSRLTRSRVRQLILAGAVRIRPSRKVKPGTRLHRGDEVVLLQLLDETPFRGTLRMLSCTPAFVAFDKPAGLLTHPTARAYYNTALTMAHELGYPEAQIVHRLDRETSGVLLMARDSTAARTLGGLFAHGGIEKRYAAIVLDAQRRYLPGDVGTIEVPLGFRRDVTLQNIIIGAGEWSARTHYQCESRCDDLALLDVRIEGGRQHQIRVHMAMLDTPVAGDKLYLHGEEFYRKCLDGEVDYTRLRCPTHALHAKSLSFVFEGKEVQVDAPLPSMFRTLLSI